MQTFACRLFLLSTVSRQTSLLFLKPQNFLLQSLHMSDSVVISDSEAGK